ncbi:monocarboxylate transporter 14-like [Saccostrea echinata]|uniref:monocarboxylate transporter 14-like n=1 Tax=Saccostrea echinata TaxID=191078 RepID=UPI002A80A596|nr:monocarboxylate transporter 14-like [Saccostrea echinata]
MTLNRRESDVDRGWAWAVLGASFLSLLLNGCLLYGVGITHVAFLRLYKESDAYTSFLGSLFSSLLQLIGPVASLSINVFNCRLTMIVGGLLIFIGCSATYFAYSLEVAILTYGIIAGIGNGLVATPPLVAVGYYFREKRGFAIGFAVAGAGTGMFISGPLFQYLIDSYELQGTMLILGAIFSNQIILGCIMRPSETEIHHKALRNKSKDGPGNKFNFRKHLHLEIFCDKMFVVILLQFLIWNIPFSMLLLHLPNFSVVYGSSEQQAAFLIFLIGLTGTIGRVLTGMAVSPHAIDPVLMNMGITGVLGIICGLFPFYSSTYAGQCTFAALFGIYSGALTTMITPLSVELLGLEKLSSAVGIMYCIGGIGYLIGPIFAGTLIDSGGKYETTFYISGCLLIIASLLTLLSTCWRKDYGSQTERTDQYETPTDSQTMKNSTFLYQSGLLAGSIIIQADEHLGSTTSAISMKNPRILRLNHQSGEYESEESLFKNIMLRKLQKNSSACSSQYSLFKDHDSIRHDTDNLPDINKSNDIKTESALIHGDISNIQSKSVAQNRGSNADNL